MSNDWEVVDNKNEWEVVEEQPIQQPKKSLWGEVLTAVNPLTRPERPTTVGGAFQQALSSPGPTGITGMMTGLTPLTIGNILSNKVREFGQEYEPVKTAQEFYSQKSPIAGGAFNIATGVAFDPRSYLMPGKIISPDVNKSITKIGETIEKLPIVKQTKELGNIRGQLSQVKKELGADIDISDLPKYIESKIDKSKTLLTNLKKDFSKIFETETQMQASTIKPKLIKFSDKLSENYGNFLDEIDHIVTHQDVPLIITKGDLGSGFVERALNNVSDDSESLNKIINLAEKQGFKINSIPDETGNMVYRAYHPDFNTPIDIKEVINIKNLLRPKLSTTSIGKIGYKKSDNAYRAIREAFGDFITDKYPQAIGEKYVELQRNYSQLANAKWRANKIFKPYDVQDFDLSKGAKFLKEYVIGSYNQDKQNLLNLIEKGSDFSPGIGENISTRLKSLGDIKLKSEKDLTNFIDNMFSKKEKVDELISQEKNLVKTRLKILGILGIVGTGEEAIKYGIKKIKGH